jgi:DNA-directed RNA polymerase subunit F
MRIVNKGEFLSLAEVIKILEKEKELTPEQRAALEHAKECTNLGVKDAKKLVGELRTLKLPDSIVYKIVDILPEDVETVVSILSTQRSRIKEEIVKDILSITKKYLGE